MLNSIERTSVEWETHREIQRKKGRDNWVCMKSQSIFYRFPMCIERVCVCLRFVMRTCPRSIELAFVCHRAHVKCFSFVCLWVWATEMFTILYDSSCTPISVHMKCTVAASKFGFAVHYNDILMRFSWPFARSGGNYYISTSLLVNCQLHLWKSL